MILEKIVNESWFPLGDDPGRVMIGNQTLGERLRSLLSRLPENSHWREDYFPDPEYLSKLCGKSDFTVYSSSGLPVGWSGNGREKVTVPGILLVYPWDLLEIPRLLIGKLTGHCIEGVVSSRAEVDGHLILGQGSRILPGVYIEGNCVIGKNCKIGPNCYLRGNTFIGDNCHIGQAVEIKNSIIGNDTSIGHLSYAGDSVIGSRVNFGAGTIISNLRHDGKDHHSLVNGKLVATGRRKFGAIIGDDVHTGIHTSIYCGRKLASGSMTLPGMAVKTDL